LKHLVIASAAVLALSGCASIFNGKTQAVVVNSVPTGATASVMNRAGEQVHTGVTPVTLTLNRGAGYFVPENYTITLTKPGFDTKQITLSSTLSGWYIGNILFGGLIGMLAVDPITGAMYSFPDATTAELQTEGTKTSQAQQPLTIVSTETLGAAQMQQARLLAPATQSK
jgi:hypothetical protein